MAGGPIWTQEEIATLTQLLEEHASYAAIGQRLGRKPYAVYKYAVYELGINLRAGNGCTIRQVHLLFGVNRRKVHQWINGGHLQAHDAGLRGGIRIVEHAELERFIADEAVWHLFDPTKITDSAWREWAIEVRAGVRYLSLKEVGQVLFLTSSELMRRIRSGQLRAVRAGWNWRVRSDWLPRSTESAPKTFRRFSESEKQQMRAWHGRHTVPWIARRLKRAESSVYTWYQTHGYDQKARKAS